MKAIIYLITNVLNCECLIQYASMLVTIMMTKKNEKKKKNELFHIKKIISYKKNELFHINFT